MNDNFDKRNANDDEQGAEEIRFDDRDFQNPYSDYARRGDSGSGDFGGNPYSQYYGDYEPPREGRAYEPYSRRKYTPPLADEERERKNLSRLGFAYAVFTLVTFAAALIIQVIVMAVSREFYESTLFLNLVTPISLYVFALPVLLILLSKCEGKAPEKRKMSFGSFVLFVIAAFGFMYIGALVGNGVMEFLSRAVGYDYSNALNGIVDEDNIWLTAIFTVIVAPIGEEFVFRKLIIDRTHKYGAFVSIGLSGLMFGLMHANFYQFFYCFLLGLLLGYVYYTTGRLYLTVILHAIVNFVGSVLTSFLMPVSDGLGGIDPANTEELMQFIMANIAPMIGLLIFSAFTYISMLCAVIFPIVFRKKLLSRLHTGEVEIPKSRILPVVILSGGMIFMLAVYLVEFGLNLLPI